MATITRLLLLALAVARLASIDVASGLPRERPWPRRLFPSSDGPNIRSAFHFQPKYNWMNDPNGPMFYKGFYHLFYQYNPDAPVWGNITWGHAVSEDLVNWIHLPIALRGDQWYDQNGCWSGSATLLPSKDGGPATPVLAYTGFSTHRTQLQCLAHPKDASDPLLVEWVKPEYNPVAGTPKGVNASQFRDPSTAWRGGDGKWRMLVGAKTLEGVDQVLVMRSADFVEWTVEQQPLHSVGGRPGAWECPDMFPVSTAHSNGLDTGYLGPSARFVIKGSFDDVRADFYAIGSYDDAKGTWTKMGNGPDIGASAGGLRYDYGVYYASKTFFDPRKGRRILLGWVGESDSEGDDWAKHWASLQALPRSISLDLETGMRLLQWPVEEVAELRGHLTEALTPMELQPGQREQLRGASGSQADIEVEFNISTSDAQGSLGPFGISVLVSDNAEEATDIILLARHQNGAISVDLSVDLARSSRRSEVEKPVYRSSFSALNLKTGILSLRVLVDNTIVEVFAQGGLVVTTARVYPTLAVGNKAHLELFNNGTGPVVVTRARAWNMKAARFETRT